MEIGELVLFGLIAAAIIARFILETIIRIQKRKITPQQNVMQMQHLQQQQQQQQQQHQPEQQQQQLQNATGVQNDHS